jgi:hypothetical protein
MLEASFRSLERRGEIENRAPVLNSDNAPNGKTSAISRTVNLVNDWSIDVTASQEIGMQRMCATTFDGVMRRGQCLTQHLTAEYLCRTDVTALAGVYIVLDLFKTKQCEQVSEYGMH